MPRSNWSDGQELVYGDFNALTARLERELYDRIWYESLQRTENSFFGDGLVVGYVGAALVSVNKGLGFQTDNTQLDPEPTKRPVYNVNSQNVALAPADGALNRIDIICVQAGRGSVLTQSRNYKDPSSGVISAQNLSTETDWQCSLLAVAGTPNASPAVPATPAGYIKLAEVLVHAVTGVTGGGDITDRRALMPIGGNVVLNTLGFQRMTAGSAVALSTLIADIDSKLKFGYQNYTDFDVLGADPALPAASKVRFYQKGGLMYVLDSAGTVTPVGSGGGGGGGANWYGAPSTSPVEDTENGEKVWMFDKANAGAQQVTLFVRVPLSYISGRQITAYLGHYSPSAANTILLKTTASLVRKDTDAVGSTANQRVSGNAALTNTVANMYRQAVCDLTDPTGHINGFAVSPGDMIRVDLIRGTDTDTADLRFLPSSTELKFS